MSTAILVAVVLAAALACPAMMWWHSRRGRTAPCCAPGRSEEPPVEDLAALRRRHTELSARLAELEGAAPPAADGREPAHERT